MKLSISLPTADVAVIDRYAEQTGLPSRSAVIQAAVESLRHDLLKRGYLAAYADWGAETDEALWADRCRRTGR